MAIRRLLPRAGCLTFLVVVFAALAHAQHEATGQGNASQLNLPHADSSIAATASPTPILGANPNAVTRLCRLVTATTARLGDSTTAATTGYLLDSTVPSVRLDTTDQIYAYSAGGGTVNCHEVIRNP